MKPLRSTLTRLGVVLTLAAAAGWLTPPPMQAQTGEGPAGHWRHAGPRGWWPGGHFGKVVTGEPYTATAITNSANTLADGTNITRKITATIARDSQGRTMRSQTFSGFGAGNSQNGTTVVSIFDPVANQRIEYSTTTKVARVFVLPQGAGEQGGNKAGWDGHGKHPHDVNGQVQTVSLGTQTIDGVAAQGTKTIRTVPAGAMGNDKPIVITEEKWYSPDLQMVLKSARSDPRIGQTTYTVSNLERTEPNVSLFQVPTGYQTKTIDLPQRHPAQ